MIAQRLQQQQQQQQRKKKDEYVYAAVVVDCEGFFNLLSTNKRGQD